MRRYVMIIMALGVVGGTLATSICASVHAAGTWFAPNSLTPSGGGTIQSTALATDAKGDAVSVWWREGVGIESAFRLAETPNWSAPVAVSGPAGISGVPQVGIDAQGDAVAVWQGGLEEKVEAAVRPASSGLWQTPVAISPEGAAWSRPQVAVDARGDAVAVWSSPYPEDGSGALVNEMIQASVRPAGTEEWEPATWVSGLGKGPEKKRFSEAPQVAIDAEGETIAVWEEHTSESASVVHYLIEAAIKPPGSSTWGPSVVLAEMGRQPQVAMDARGDATVVWSAPDGLYSATFPASSSTWQPGVRISATEAERPRVGMDSFGDAIAVWESIGATTNTVQAAVQLAGAVWGAPANLSEPVEYNHGYPRLFPNMTVNTMGSAAATWDGSANDLTVQGAILPAVGASWQAPVQLADTHGAFVIPLIGMDEKGNGMAVWARGGKANAVVEAANYDDSSPVLEATSIPSTAQTGKPLVFSVSPLAITTALGQTRWSFGDGSQSVTGTSVGHAFMKPGSYPVTVTTADVLGNTTSVSSTITVTNAPIDPKCECRRPRLTLSNVRVANKRFRVAGSSTEKRLHHRTFPFGTAFRFTLSENASVQIEVRTVGSRSCKKRRTHCVHVQVLGTLKSTGVPAGSDGVAFRGLVGKHILRPGHYLAILTAYNGSEHSKVVDVQFAVAQ